MDESVSVSSNTSINTTVDNNGKPPTTVDVEVPDTREGENVSTAPSYRDRDEGKQRLRRKASIGFADRDEWSHPVDCVFSMIGFAVALSNVSRFFLFYFYNGRICFLIPYILFTLICAFPLLYMECIMGQFFREGFISVWKIVPVMKGIGYSIGLLLFANTICYLTPLTWCLLYLYECFSDPVPWSTCNNLWNTAKCVEMIPENFYDSGNKTNETTAAMERQSAGLEFFKGRVLQSYKSFYTDPPQVTLNKTAKSNDTERYGFDTNLGLGPVRTELALILLAVYITIYLLLTLDMKWIGRLTRLTVTLPFAVLSVLFFRGIVLEGAIGGLKEFFIPDYLALFERNTWLVGAVEALYSLGCGFGPHLVIASHNHFHHNIFRDCIITVVVNLVISLFGALIMSEYLGHWATIQNLNITYFVETHTLPKTLDIIFVVLPDATSHLAGGSIFLFLFLFMVLLIVYDTFLIAIKSLVVGIGDEFRHWFSNSYSAVKIFLFANVSIVYVINLLCVTHGGIWFYFYIDEYAVTVPVLITIFMQCFGIVWIWGLAELCEATEAISGSKPGIFMRLCWKIIVPAFIFTLFVLSFFHPHSLKVDDQALPKLFHYCGLVIKYVPILPIPIYAITQCVQRPEGQTRKQRMQILLTPQYQYHRHPQVDKLTGKTLTIRHFMYFGPLKVEKLSLFNKNTTKVHPEDLDPKKSPGQDDSSAAVPPPPVPQNSKVDTAESPKDRPKQLKRVASDTSYRKKKPSAVKKVNSGRIQRSNST